MKLCLAAAFALCLVATSALAQAVPPNSYFCHSVGDFPVPLGTFVVTGADSFEWIATNATNFAANTADPSNGTGSFSIEGDVLIVGDGAFADAFERPSAKIIVGDTGGTQLWFANTGGGVLNCRPK